MLTQSRLKERLHYNPATGEFTWLVSGHGVRKGEIAGSPRAYRTISIDDKPYRACRLAWLYMMGCWPTKEIDHKNRDRHDDRWSNLREATRSQNQANAPIYKNNKSGEKGVHFRKDNGKWRAAVRVNGRIKSVGDFDNLQDAIAARRAAAAVHYGEFAASP